MLQAPIMDKIKVSNEVGEELTQALAQGRSVTAKVRWISKPGDRGRNRWIAFTPLVGSHKQIGVWIAILVDDEVESRKRPRRAPPVKWRVGGPPIPTPKKPSTTPAHAAVTTDVNNRVPADMPWEQPVPVPSLSERPLSSPKEPPAPAVPPKPAVTAAVAAHVTQPKPASVLEGDPDIDENYETLEVRLRKKRERDAARLLDQPGAAAVKPTYKSLSPYAFMNNDAP